MTIEPIRKVVRVPLSVTAAFELFTDGIASWWPLDSHSVAGDDAQTVVFEPNVGGRIYEVSRHGVESEWGQITAWSPPDRVVFTWHPGRSSRTQGTVAVTFADAGRDDSTHETIVTLEHSGWERLGEGAVELHRNYDSGWDLVLGRCYAAQAGVS